MKIAGLALGIIVVILLGIVITIVDQKITLKGAEIDELKYNRDVRLAENWPQYLSYTSKEKIIRLTKMVADISSMSEKERNAIYSEYLEARREALVKLYATLKGELPTAQQTNAWKEMSIDQLINEQANIVSEENLTELMHDIKGAEKELYSLEMNKNNIIIIATVLQICALFLATFSKKLNE
jgi:hypothetical protein